MVWATGLIYVICQDFFNLSLFNDFYDSLGEDVDHYLNIVGFHHYKYISFYDSKAYNYMVQEFSISELAMSRFFGTSAEFYMFLLLQIFIHLLEIQDDVSNYLKNAELKEQHVKDVQSGRISKNYGKKNSGSFHRSQFVSNKN